MKRQHKRTAFTMIELLFVIVIMGIVGGLALEAIRQYYEGVYRTQEHAKRIAQADHILEQLSKYFETAISSSIVNLDVNETGTGCFGPPVSGDTSDYTVAFIGVDTDSLRGSNRPGWSEEVRLMTNNELNASDGNYTIADTTITALYPASSLRGSAIYDADSIDVASCARFGLNGGVVGGAGYHRLNNAVNPISSTVIRLNADNNATDGRRKYLLRTGYAFRVDNNGTFRMYSNFRPWAGERYANANVGANVKANILGENVAHFYADYNATDFMNNPGVSDRGLVWRLKVCMRGLDANLSTSDTESQAICRERRVHVRY